MQQNKQVRVFGSNAQRQAVSVPVVKAPRSIVGAIECCCKDS